MINGKVVSLFTAPYGGDKMISADHLSCLADEGIEGDRYALGTGTYSKKPEPGRQLTIIEIEELEALKHFPDISCLAEQCYFSRNTPKFPCRKDYLNWNSRT